MRNVHAHVPLDRPTSPSCLIFLCLLVLVLVLSGCGGNDSASTADSAPQTHRKADLNEAALQSAPPKSVGQISADVKSMP